MIILSVIISRNEARWLKPHPKGVELACERLGCYREEVCFLGDSLDDIRAAQSAGVPVVILAGGQDGLQKIQDGRPDGILGEWNKLPLFLKQKGGCCPKRTIRQKGGLLTSIKIISIFKG